MDANELLRLVRVAALQVDQRIEQGTLRNCAEGYPSQSQLEVVRRELTRIEDDLVKTENPSEYARPTSMGRMITDDWWKCDQEPLTKMLLSVSDSYNRLQVERSKK